MTDHTIANILYNTSLDLDYADYIEFADQEVKSLTAEITKAREMKLDNLIQIIEILAEQNSKLKNWHLERR